VIEIPYLEIVAVDNIRTGFLEIPEYRRLLNCLPPSLKMFLVLAYHGGCRSGELKGLKWVQVHRNDKFIKLEKTKNGKDRNFPIYGDMDEWLDRQEQIRDAECPDCEYVLFWHAADALLFPARKAGGRLKGFGGAWRTAAKKAGFVTKILPHDMRRSAVSNIIDYVGMTETQAMRITGHLTPAMIGRYNIGSLKGALESGKKMDTWMKAETTKAIEQERLNPAPVEPAPLTMKQRVRDLYIAQEKTVEEIIKALNIAESTVHYHLSGDKWKKKRLGPSSALQVQA
jgi:integrase